MTSSEDDSRNPVGDLPEPITFTPEEGIAESEADREVVEQGIAEIRDLFKETSVDDVKSGAWFTKLLQNALGTYTDKVNWEYFQEKYAGVPADAIVDQRIKMAARYAAIEGGLSASVYTGAVALTIGSLGGASPVAVPAAAGTLLVDVAYVSQLQIRLAYDIAVLYRVPLDLDDPEDLWKLIRIAFTIKGGEFVRGGAVKAVPAFVRPLLKRYYSKGVLAAARGLPYVGKFLLQRNVIKIGIPVVGVPLGVIMNRYTTLVAGRHAREVFRNEARIIETANSLASRAEHPNLLLWVTWLIINADQKISDDEALLLRHLVKSVTEQHGIQDEILANLVELIADDVFEMLDKESGDLNEIISAATIVATIDGNANKHERALIDELTNRYGTKATT